MSLIANYSITYFQRFCLNVIKCGPIPRHIAFIMDGNRRYAEKIKMNMLEVHGKGANKLEETLLWGMELGVLEMTVYGFSIENFKRRKIEVEVLLSIIEEKLAIWLENKERLREDGICVRVIGDISLLPQGLRKVVAGLVLSTKDNKGTVINMALGYRSRDEIFNSATTILKAVENDQISVSDIHEDLIADCLYTSKSPDPDMIVRTSGVTRFSDFLLWQTSNSFLCFIKPQWPEFSFWDFLGCVFKYQRCYDQLPKRQAKKEKNERVEDFLACLEEERVAQLNSYL